MGRHDLQRGAQEAHLVDELHPVLHVLAHLGLLVEVEWAGLQEDAVGDPQLADVVQQEAVDQLRIRGQVRFEVLGQDQPVVGHPVDVPAGDLVADVDGGRQRGDGLEVRAGQLVGGGTGPGERPAQVPGVGAQLVVQADDPVVLGPGVVRHGACPTRRGA